MTKQIGFDHSNSKVGPVKQFAAFIGFSLKDAIIRIFNFGGRTSRGTFWTAFLVFALAAVFALACEIWALEWGLGSLTKHVVSMFLFVRYISLWILVPLIVRRLHDVDQSILSALNPFSMRRHPLGMFAYLFETGNSSLNKFGAPHDLSFWRTDPKKVG